MLSQSVRYLLLLLVLCMTGYGYAHPAARKISSPSAAAFNHLQHPAKKKLQADLLVYNETTEEQDDDDAQESAGFSAGTGYYPDVCRYLLHVSYYCFNASIPVKPVRAFPSNRYLHNRVIRI